MSPYNKHVVVLGSARSGTSWLSENLAKPFRYRMMFEPEHDERTTYGHLLTDQYFINSNKVDLHAIEYLEKILKNRVDCDWIAQNSNRKYKMHLWPFIPKKFIVKFVRFNLSGAFLSKLFDVPVVHIIRNPIDVIESQKRVNFPWLYDFKYFLEQDDLVDLIQSNFDYDLTQIEEKSNTEKLAVRWCIENVIPLQINTVPDDKFRVIKHEDLRQDVEVFKKLCQDLSLEVVNNIEGEYKKPSSKTHPKSRVHGREKHTQSISNIQETNALDILNQFNQKLYVL